MIHRHKELGVGAKIYKAATGGQDANLLTGSSEISILLYLKNEFDPVACHMPSIDSTMLVSIPFYPDSSMVAQLAFVLEQNTLLMRNGNIYGWSSWTLV